MKLRCLVAAALLWLSGPAAAGDPALFTRAGPRLVHLLTRKPAPKEPVRLVTIWGERPASPQAVCVGPVCAQRIDPSQLPGLLSTPGLLTAELPARLRLRLDVAGPQTGIPQARQRLGLDGRGVLVALIDTGLDWFHPDFRTTDGRTRVRWLLDQSLPPAGLHPELEAIGRGAVFGADDLQQVLDTGLGPARGAGLDVIGHGTHVAGIAAGDDPVYTGMAPGAELVVVKAIDADLGGFSEDRVLAGLAFARRVALDEGRPLVINLSLGTQLGAHDGSEPLELALETLAEEQKPPCAITVAAGNEAGLGIHARGAVQPQGPPLRFEVLLAQTEPPAVNRPARVSIDLWSDGGGRVDAWLVSPSGWRSDPIGPRSGAWDETAWSPDGLVELSAAAAPHPVNGLYRLRIALSGEPGLALASGTWTIFLGGQAGRIDAWIGDWDLAGGPSPRFVGRVDPGDLVGPPATARSVVAVGASIGRTSWPGADGAEHRLGDAISGALAAFSVHGPTRDGRLKPELVAPGQAIASSLSADADPRSPSSIFYAGGSLALVLPGGRHAVASGTSMAAPFVAGLCALAFERQPASTGRELQERLRVTSRADDQTSSRLFDPGWGFGKLDGLRLLAAGPATGEPEEFVDPAQSLCGAGQDWLPSDPDARLWITAVPRSADGQPLGPGRAVRIEAGDDARFAGGVIDLGQGLYARALTGSGQRGQRLRATCSLDGRAFEARPAVRLAASAAEASEGGVRGGAISCAQAGPRSRTPLWPWIGIGLWFGIGWLRRRL